MSGRLEKHPDKLLLAFALGILATSCVWGWRHRLELHRLRALPVTPLLTGASYQPASLRLPEPEPAVWPKAPAQSHGGGWLYEVFTPPVVYYNAGARSFAVTVPLSLNEGGRSFGLELLAVKPEPYRLQLVGYFGGSGNYLAAFISPDQPGTILARQGRRFDTLGLTLRSIEVRKVPVEHGDAWPVYEVAALAVLQDDRTGAEVVLDSRKRKFTDTPLAVLKLTAADGKPRELREGDTFSDDNSIYRIERIQFEPPEVVVARQAPGLSQPETRVLHPVGQEAGRIAGNSRRSFPHRPSSPGLAANDPPAHEPIDPK